MTFCQWNIHGRNVLMVKIRKCWRVYRFCEGV